MSNIYRTYDSGWNRTGYSDKPQYPGQQPCRNGIDFPPLCPECGGGITRVVLTMDGYVASCAKGHRVDQQAVALDA